MKSLLLHQRVQIKIRALAVLAIVEAADLTVLVDTRAAHQTLTHDHHEIGAATAPSDGDQNADALLSSLLDHGGL